MTHLTFKTQFYNQKKGRQSNCQFDFRPLKIRNRPNFIVSRWRATYHGKFSPSATTLLQTSFQLEGLHTKLWAPKVVEIPTLGILGLPLESHRTKCQLGASPVARHKVYYKGEGGGFPQVWAMVSLVTPCLLVARPCTKMFQLHIKQLVIWFVQMCE